MENRVSIWKVISIVSIILILMIVTFLVTKYFIEVNNYNVVNATEINVS